MIVTFAEHSYDCTKAVRDGDRAVLSLTQGGTVELIGITSWDALSIEDGAWSAPEVTDQEQLRADVDFLAAMTGVMLV